MEILPATAEDADEIVALVRVAFSAVAAEYGVASLPPLSDTAEQLRTQMRTHTVLKAVEDGRIVGSVRAVLWRGTCEVGRLVVHPDLQGRGIGTALAREIETHFPDAERFELFTGHRSGPSLHIYGALGYVPFRIEPVADSLQLVYMEKRRGRKGPAPRA